MSEVGAEVSTLKSIPLKEFIQQVLHPAKSKSAEATAPANDNHIFTSPMVFLEENGRLNFASNGLYAEFDNMDNDMSIELPDTTTLDIFRGDIIAEIDFLPFGLAKYQKGTKTLTMARGIKGFSDLFSMMEEPNTRDDKKPLPYPKYIAGITNARMAQFAQRIGFHIYGEDLDGLLVVGKTEEVRNMVKAYDEKYGSDGKFTNRSIKEHRTRNVIPDRK